MNKSLSRTKAARRVTRARRTRNLGALGLSAVLAAVTACGSRDAFWDEPADGYATASLELAKSVVVLDEGAHRALLLSVPDASLGLQTHALPVGSNVTALAASPDRKRAYVLARGASERLETTDERPSLTVIADGPVPSVERTYSLTDPVANLVVDPRGEWVALYGADGVVDNPNELILVPVTTDGPPVTKTVRSYGARPRRLTFTDPLDLPGGTRRLLVVETDSHLGVVDLANPSGPELTLRLPDDGGTGSWRPEEVVASAGEPNDPNDARLAVRLQGRSDILVATLGPATEAGRGFSLSLSIADAGGVPTSLDFVSTDGGPRLAALVPSRSDAVLIDLSTSVVQRVALPRPFTAMARVTADLSKGPDAADVALLWGAGASHDGAVAFWALGRTTGKPYRSVESLGLGAGVSGVRSIPGSTYGHLKLLETEAGESFYVLDLDTQTSSPLLTNSYGSVVKVSSDGERVWALGQGQSSFGMLALDTLHPTSIATELPIREVFDIARSDGGRAVIALHATGTLATTVFDGLTPDSAVSTHQSNLLFREHP